MNKPVLSAFDQSVVRYGQWLLSHRLLVILGVLGLLGLSVYAAWSLQFKDNYRVYFGEDNPQLQAFEEIQNVYTKDDGLMFVVTAKSGEVFERGTLNAVAELTEQSWQLPFSIRVDSITNYQHTTAQDDDLLVENLVFDADSMSDDELTTAREIAVNAPVLRNRLINETASITAVSVLMQLPEISLNEVAQAVAAARELASSVEAKYPGVSLRLAGTSMMNNAFAESARSDIATLVPAMYLVILLGMVLIVRCVMSALATAIIVLGSITIGMGFAGAAGIFLSSPAASAPTVITTLAVADCVHIIISTFAKMRGGMNKHDAIVDALRINLQPVFLTSVTTAIGFLTMNFLDSPPFHDLGNITAAGVMAGFLLSVTLLPVLLSVLPCRTPKTASGGHAMLERFADMVIARRKPLMIGGLILSAAFLALIPLNELDDNFVEYFDTAIEFRRDIDYTNENLTGTILVNYSLPAGREGGVSDPEYLRQVEAFADWYREQEHVVHVNTVTDVFKRLNKSLHNDDPAYYRLPEDSQLGAQYLLLYELSLPQGLDLTNQINLDKSASRLVATVNTISSKNQRALVARSEQWLEQNAPALATKGVGVAVMFSYISERNIRSMIGGSVFGLILISAILMVALRSVKMGLLSLVPNLLPIGLTFGIWSLLVGQVNMAASVVSGMVLGIVVDDTVHFLSKYLRARRENGLSPTDAVRYAFATVGTALVVTTIILIAGFCVLAQSNFEINSTMATLTAMAIFLALAVDFLLLPPILLKFDRGDGAVVDTPNTKPNEETSHAPSLA
ncbi:MAG: RND family transporter [Gammaproteobacteria bacterium]